MGAHKHNPVAIAAKNEELPPKKKPELSKREREAIITKSIEDLTGITELKHYINLNGGGY